MGRRITYGIVGGLLTIALGGLVLVFLFPSLDHYNPFQSILFLLIVLLGILFGIWLGGFVNKKLKQKPLSQELDRRLSYFFV